MEHYIIIGLAICVVILLIYTVKSFTYSKIEKKIKPLKVKPNENNIDFFDNKKGFIAKKTKLAVKNTGQVINMIDMGNGKVLIVEESPYFIDEMDAYVGDQIINSIEINHDYKENKENKESSIESSDIMPVEDRLENIDDIKRAVYNKDVEGGENYLDIMNNVNLNNGNTGSVDEYDTNDEYETNDEYIVNSENDSEDAYVPDEDDENINNQKELF